VWTCRNGPDPPSPPNEPDEGRKGTRIGINWIDSGNPYILVSWSHELIHTLGKPVPDAVVTKS
jgi:hypothetical protein